MSKNQFYYTRKETRAPKEGEEGPQFTEHEDSFNLNKVIRTLSMLDGRTVVVLDDTHERIENDVPVKNAQGRQTGSKNVRFTYQSEVFLSPEDAKRLKIASEFVVIQ